MPSLEELEQTYGTSDYGTLRDIHDVLMRQAAGQSTSWIIAAHTYFGTIEGFQSLQKFFPSDSFQLMYKEFINVMASRNFAMILASMGALLLFLFGRYSISGTLPLAQFISKRITFYILRLKHSIVSVPLVFCVALTVLFDLFIMLLILVFVIKDPKQVVDYTLKFVDANNQEQVYSTALVPSTVIPQQSPTQSLDLSIFEQFKQQFKSIFDSSQETNRLIAKVESGLQGDRLLKQFADNIKNQQRKRSGSVPRLPYNTAQANLDDEHKLRQRYLAEEYGLNGGLIGGFKGRCSVAMYVGLLFFFFLLLQLFKTSTDTFRAAKQQYASYANFYEQSTYSRHPGKQYAYGNTSVSDQYNQDRYAPVHNFDPVAFVTTQILGQTQDFKSRFSISQQQLEASVNVFSKELLRGTKSEFGLSELIQLVNMIKAYSLDGFSAIASMANKAKLLNEGRFEQNPTLKAAMEANVLASSSISIPKIANALFNIMGVAPQWISVFLDSLAFIFKVGSAVTNIGGGVAFVTGVATVKLLGLVGRAYHAVMGAWFSVLWILFAMLEHFCPEHFKGTYAWSRKYMKRHLNAVLSGTDRALTLESLDNQTKQNLLLEESNRLSAEANRLSEKGLQLKELKLKQLQAEKIKASEVPVLKILEIANAPEETIQQQAASVVEKVDSLMGNIGEASEKQFEELSTTSESTIPELTPEEIHELERREENEKKAMIKVAARLKEKLLESLKSNNDIDVLEYFLNKNKLSLSALALAYGNYIITEPTRTIQSIITAEPKRTGLEIEERNIIYEINTNDEQLLNAARLKMATGTFLFPEGGYHFERQVERQRVLEKNLQLEPRPSSDPS